MVIYCEKVFLAADEKKEKRKTNTKRFLIRYVLRKNTETDVFHVQLMALFAFFAILLSLWPKANSQFTSEAT